MSTHSHGHGPDDKPIPPAVSPETVKADLEEREELMRWKQTIEERLDRLETQVEAINLRKSRES